MSTELNFDYAAAVKYLYALGDEIKSIKLGLENTGKLLAALGNPERSFVKVQIAGTNGKGSTSAFLSSILRAAGINAGLNTSPHLVEIKERVRVRDADITREEFAACVAEVKTAADKLRKEDVLPTFFEHLTATALVAFRRAKCKVGVLEVGLGGRLDSTTATLPEIVAITPIALDHTKILGDTLEKIAAEKAAVIRADTPAVIAQQPAAAREVILARCAALGVTPRYDECEIVLHEADATGHLRVSFTTRNAHYSDCLLALRGAHQATNAAVAVQLAEELQTRGFAQITTETIRQGLVTARHAGRLDLREINGRQILFDGAHNVAGAETLRAFLEHQAQPVTMIFGAMRDKDVAKIAALLFPFAQKLILTQTEKSRAMPSEELAGIAAEHLAATQIQTTPDISTALQKAFENTAPDELIIVTGSLYLVGAAMEECRINP